MRTSRTNRRAAPTLVGCRCNVVLTSMGGHASRHIMTFEAIVLRGKTTRMAAETLVTLAAVRVYFPIGACIVVSIVATIVVNVFLRR